MLKRESLRDQIREEVRARIIRGDLGVDTRLSEAELATELGVSRTPLREALISLEQEGFLEASPGRGFSVLPLSNDEYQQLLPVIGALERITLLSCPLPSLKQLEELRLINLEFLKTGELKTLEERTVERVRTDMLWHEVLLEGANNEKAADLLHRLKLQWRRYEYAFWAAQDNVEPSVKEHTQIIRLLEEGQKEEAANHLEKQWQVATEVQVYLESRT